MIYRLNFLLFVSILFTQHSFAQDYVSKIAEATCSCIDDIQGEGLSADELQTQMGLCMITASGPYTKQLKKDHNIDLTKNPSKSGKKLGELVAMSMFSVCPDYVLALAGQGSFADAQAKRKGTKSITTASDDTKQAAKPTQAGNSITGKITALKKDKFYTVAITDQEGKTHKLLWLEYFKNSEQLLNGLDSLKSKTVEITFIEKELYSPELGEYIKTKIITELTF